jgi:hypothetical protein
VLGVSVLLEKRGVTVQQRRLLVSRSFGLRTSLTWMPYYLIFHYHSVSVLNRMLSFDHVADASYSVKCPLYNDRRILIRTVIFACVCFVAQ